MRYTVYINNANDINLSTFYTPTQEISKTKKLDCLGVITDGRHYPTQIVRNYPTRAVKINFSFI